MRAIPFRFAIRLAATTIALSAPLTAQLPLGDPLPVNVATDGDQESPSLGMREDGRFTVVWTDLDAVSHDVLQRTYQSDGTPFSPSTLNQFLTGEQRLPQISMNAGGDWVAAWESQEQNPGSARDLFGRRTSNNGATLSNEFQANATSAHDAVSQKVSRADDDSFVVIWRDAADETDVYFRRIGAGGTALTGDEIANQAAANDAFEGNVASGPDGSFVATWTGLDAVTSGVLARCFDGEGVAFGNEFRLNEDEAGSQQIPRVAADARGAFVAVWREGGTTGHYELRLFHPDCTPRSGDLPLDNVLTGTRFNPDVDMASDGAFVVTWGGSSQDADDGVSAREFTKSGNPVGGQFVVPTAAAGRQSGSVVGVGATIFAVAWTDQEGTVGVDDDIFVRRYLRRVVFTEDFESGDFFYWSDVNPEP